MYGRFRDHLAEELAEAVKSNRSPHVVIDRLKCGAVADHARVGTDRIARVEQYVTMAIVGHACECGTRFALAAGTGGKDLLAWQVTQVAPRDEPRQVFWRYHLGVFEREANVPAVLAGLLQRGFESVQRNPVGRVANRVNAHVEADVQELDGSLCRDVFRRARLAVEIGVVRVLLEEVCAT